MEWHWLLCCCRYADDVARCCVERCSSCTYIRMYIRTYVHIYIRTYILYIHMYVRMFVLLLLPAFTVTIVCVYLIKVHLYEANIFISLIHSISLP